MPSLVMTLNGIDRKVEVVLVRLVLSFPLVIIAGIMSVLVLGLGAVTWDVSSTIEN